MEQIETQGITISSKCETKSAKKNHDKKPITEILDYDATLKILEKGGFIKKNSAGKFLITKKGKQKLLKGFKIAHK